MPKDRSGQIVVIFLSIRTDADDAGYGEAADAMESLAAVQPGYCGIESTRGPEGLGITLSFWADTASALCWRDHPEHAAIRDAGRDRWYQRYEVIVCEAQRSYAWQRSGEAA
ncbi:MAG: antibiotic biosynthesis monooxygenase [Sphingomonas sp.]